MKSRTSEVRMSRVDKNSLAEDAANNIAIRTFDLQKAFFLDILERFDKSEGWEDGSD